MVNMKNIAVCYDKISAFDMLVDIAKVAGIESIQAALNEIAAQQSVQADGACACPKSDTGSILYYSQDCKVHALPQTANANRWADAQQKGIV